MHRDINEVILTGNLTPCVSADGKQVGGRLCSSEPESEGAGRQQQVWHTLEPVTPAARESIRSWGTNGSLACVKGRFQRREYQADGQTRYANEILVYEPVVIASSSTRRAEIQVEGRLGTNPDIRYTKKGLAVITLSVATNSFRKDERAPDGWAKQTVWHRAILFGDTAREKVSSLLRGDHIRLVGELTYRLRKNREDGAVAEILVKSLSSQGTPMIAPQGAESKQVLAVNGATTAGQQSLYSEVKPPLPYAAGSVF